jgi:uncharacterized protein (AIM24 family)
MVARCDELLAGDAQAEPAPPATTPEPPPAPEPLHTPEPGSILPVRAPAAPGAGLAAWAASRVVGGSVAETFSVEGDTLTVNVRGEVLVRMDGLFASRGRLSQAGEMKRFRGRATDKPFGEGTARMTRVTGEGVLLFRTGGRRFTALDLSGDAGYFREEVVFGFEEPVVFENGRVPSQTADLNLVHLRGSGRFLIATATPPVAVDVSPDAPLRMPLAALVGWVGNLTPRVAPMVEGDESGPAAVELTGDGRVLADPAAAAEVGREE